LDVRRKSIVQISRFDPSKGIPQVIEVYSMLVQRLVQEKLEGVIPQLIIAGHGIVDDPEGYELYLKTLELVRSERYRHLAHDIKIAYLPPKDQILNVLIRLSDVGLQLSIREGWEIKVTELLAKGLPVVVYKTGVIPLQVEHNVTGFIVEAGDTMGAMMFVYQLFTDRQLHNRMKIAAMKNFNQEFTSVSNVVNYLFLATSLVRDGSIKGNGARVRDLCTAHYSGIKDRFDFRSFDPVAQPAMCISSPGDDTQILYDHEQKEKSHENIDMNLFTHARQPYQPIELLSTLQHSGSLIPNSTISGHLINTHHLEYPRDASSSSSPSSSSSSPSSSCSSSSPSSSSSPVNEANEDSVRTATKPLN